MFGGGCRGGGWGKISMGDSGRYRVSASHQQREGLGSDKVFSMAGRPLCFSGKLGCDREEESLGSESQVDEIAQHGVAWGAAHSRHSPL